MTNIVMHSYIKGPQTASRARVHLNYIQYRPGEDRTAGRKEDLQDSRSEKANVFRDDELSGRARVFHVPERDGPQAPGQASYEFRKALFDNEQRGKVVHRFILSPPSQYDVDINKYTEEMMQRISSHKGQDLRYGWVVHGNTDNPHSHVVILGKDLEGHNVRFDKVDYALMRSYGDRYLSREHGMDLEYDKDIERYARTHGHNLYMSTREQNERFLEAPERESRWQTDEDFLRSLTRKRDGTFEFLEINKNWKESLEQPTREGGLYLGSTWVHDRGRLSEVHDLYTNTKDTSLWEDVQKNATDQELKDYAEQQLASLKAERQETIEELQQKTGLSPENFDKFIEKIQKQFAEENREIDQALFPEKYEPRIYEHGEIDIDRVSDNDKIELKDGTWISKYDELEYLKDVRDVLITGPYETRLEGDDYSKLCSWIGHKEHHGESYFGVPPLKDEREMQEPALDKHQEPEDRSDQFEEITDLLKGSWDIAQLEEHIGGIGEDEPLVEAAYESDVDDFAPKIDSDLDLEEPFDGSLELPEVELGEPSYELDEQSGTDLEIDDISDEFADQEEDHEQQFEDAFDIGDIPEFDFQDTEHTRAGDDRETDRSERGDDDDKRRRDDDFNNGRD